jgi:hypothetical protein
MDAAAPEGGGSGFTIASAKLQLDAGCRQFVFR